MRRLEFLGGGVGVSSGLPCWLWLCPMQFEFVQVLIVCCILLCAEFAVHHLSIKTLFEKIDWPKICSLAFHS